MLESEADRLSMIQSLGGILVTIGSATMWAIFDRAYVEAGLSESAVEETSPTLTCRSSDLAEVRKGAVAVVDGSSFRVRRIEPDGTGMSRIILEE